MKLLLIGLTLFAIMIALHYNLGTFQSAPADPTCPRGQYSKKTGGSCSGPPLDNSDYTRVDVLNEPASIKYPDWARDPNTSRDINTNSKVSNWQFRLPKGLDDRDLPSKRSPKSPYDYRYDTSLNSAGHSLDDVYDTSYDTEKNYDRLRKNRPTLEELEEVYDKYNRLKKNGPTLEELEEVYDKKQYKFPDSEGDYMDHRLSRDQMSRRRQFDLPSSSSYNKDMTTAYDSSCNTRSYDNEHEDHVCEGFSPVL